MRRPYYEIKRSAAGKFYYLSCSANNEVLNSSEEFEDQQACRKGIAAARRMALTATVRDRT